MTLYEVAPLTRPPDLTLSLPGSKSYTSRALLIAAMAEGRSTIRQALFSDDTRYMAAALAALGIPVRADEPAREFVVEGAGGRVPAGEASLFVGNAGTAARFLTSFVALGRGRYVLDGSPRMRQRPIQPLLDGLQGLGVRARSLHGNGCPPVVVEAAGLAGGRTRMDGSQSSQFLSSLLLVGPATPLGIEVDVVGDIVSRPFVDLTTSSMRAFGAEVVNDGYRRLVVPPGQRYRARDYTVEPDASAASYFFGAAAITGGRVRVEGLGWASAQGDLGFVDVLARMGCRVSRGESFVEVAGPETLRGVDVDMRGISDTALTLAAIAPFAAGPVLIRGIAHTRHQESDRVAAAATELRRLGARVDEHPDGLAIYPAAGQLHGAEVSTYDDHRIAMAFALVGLRVPSVRIQDPECVAKTFPEFFTTLEQLGG